MAGETSLPSDHDKIVELCTSGNSDLTGKNAAPPEDDVVPDLDQIINHRAGADNRVIPGSPIDRRIGADIDIVANDDPSELWDFDRHICIGSEAEPRLANADPRVHDNP